MATSLKLDEELKLKIQHLANLKHRTPHWIMCKAINDFVDKETAQENFRQDALKSWENYQETKLHLTNEEVHNWLDTWGTEKETKMPKCHE